MVTETNVLRLLNHGKANALTCKIIAQRLETKDTRGIRLIINALVEKGVPVIGGAKGYYIADDPADVIANINFMKSYIVNLQRHITHLQIAAKNINGQMRMV